MARLNYDGNFDEWLARYRQVSGNQNPPKMYKNWIQLASSLKCSIDPMHYRQIFKDLRPYKNQKLTVEKMRELAAKIKEFGVNVSGMDSSTFIENRQKWPFMNSLLYLPYVIDPKIDFFTITHIHDEGMVAPADDDQEQPYTDMADVIKRSEAVREAHEEFADNNMLLRAPASFITVPFDVPVFSVNKLRGFNDIVVPTIRTGLAAYSGDKIEMALNAPAWENKQKRAVFRGSTTGIDFEKVRRENIPLTTSLRFKLHEMTMQQREGKLSCSVELDFGITEICQCNQEEGYIQEVKRQFPISNPVDFQTQFQSKYLVIVDGNGWPDRVANFMLSGSLIFLATLHDEWVTNQLIDGHNYIKVKPDLSDLIEKLEWAAENDEEAKRIALNGREFAFKNFGLDKMQVYNTLLFLEYQQLFSNQ